MLRVMVTAMLCVLSSTPSRAADLLSVYEQALARDPVLAGAVGRRDEARDLATLARAALLPQGVATVLSGHERDSGASQPTVSSRRTDLNVGLTQVVLDASLAARRRAAEATSSGQDDAVRAQEQHLCLRVATAYFDELLAVDTLASAQANEEAFSRQVERADQLRVAGLGAQLDVDQSRVALALARNLTIAARRGVNDARDAIAEITGDLPDDLRPLKVDLPLDRPHPDAARPWVDAALATNPAILAAAFDVEAAEHSIDAARAGYWPTLVASAGVDRPEGASYSGSSGRTAAVAQLTLVVPLFSGGATQARVGQARHQRDEAASTLETQRRTAARAASGAYSQLVTALEQVEVARQSLVAARASLDATRVGREVGKRSTNDLLQAIQDLGSAQLTLAQARHDVVLGRIKLAAAAGTLGAGDLAAVNALLQ